MKFPHFFLEENHGEVMTDIGRIRAYLVRFRGVDFSRERRRTDVRRAGRLLEEGNTLRRGGHFGEAITKYREALRHGPYSFAIYSALGAAYEGLNDFPRAQEALELGVIAAEFQHGKNPSQSGMRRDLAAIHTNLARILARQEAYPDAEDHLTTAIGLYPILVEAISDRAAIRCELAVQLWNAGRHDEVVTKLTEARGDADRAIQLQPQSSISHFNLGTILKRMGQEARARAAYAKAVELGMPQRDVDIAWENALPLIESEEDRSVVARALQWLRLRS